MNSSNHSQFGFPGAVSSNVSNSNPGAAPALSYDKYRSVLNHSKPSHLQQQSDNNFIARHLGAGNGSTSQGNSSGANISSSTDTTMVVGRAQRDPNRRPLNKLTVDLIKTYKSINEVGDLVYNKKVLFNEKHFIFSIKIFNHKFF